MECVRPFFAQPPWPEVHMKCGRAPPHTPSEEDELDVLRVHEGRGVTTEHVHVFDKQLPPKMLFGERGRIVTT